MYSIENIVIEDYNYNLPIDKIASYPLEKRDLSKLLYQVDGELSERKFKDLPKLLPSGSLLLFNETKVVNARLLFEKSTGAIIEVFCLEPVKPVVDFQLAYQQTSPVVWKCLIGNAKRWKSGILEKEFDIGNRKVVLYAEKEDQLVDGFLVKFSWKEDDITFSEIIRNSGLIPIPPYLNRRSEDQDKKRYQTIYAEYEGSVAAPTAGLHFTENVFSELIRNSIEIDKLTLHVGAGTFKPVVSEKIGNHEMHTEKVIVNIETLKHILNKIGDPIIPVGTTSMRTLESLYWMAVKLKNGDSSFEVEQWDPYHLNNDPEFSSKKAIELLIEFLEKNKQNEIKGETRLMIAPGYEFKFAFGLVTNFHQPKSTLLLLVSALVGDSWKTAYDFALSNNFRFLSYGDSCLFLPSEQNG